LKTLLVCAPDPAELDAWVGALRGELPGHRVLTAPTSGEPIAYVAVDQAPPGLIASLPGLEMVLSLNAGVERLLAPGQVPQHLPIVRMVDPGLTEGMIEWVLAQALAWHRNLFAYEASQGEGVWAPIPERLARERTVTVLGAGALGGPVALALRAVGFQVRAWSRTGVELTGVTAFAGPGGLPAALEGADVLVNLLPMTAQTLDLLDAAAFDRLADGAFVINAGRGDHLVDADLIAALDGGRLSGAALDVFREEPLPAGHPFWTHPGVRVSPHVAAQSHVRTGAAVLAETIRRWERGEPLQNLVDRARGY